jgi:hypothetical protein
MKIQTLNFILYPVIALCMLCCSDRADDLVSPDLAGLTLTLTLKNDSLPANGHNAAVVVLTVSQRILTTNHEATFIVDGGKFAENSQDSITVPLDNSGEAIVSVVSNIAGFVIVHANVGSSERTEVIRFYKPDGALIFAGTENVPADNHTTGIVSVKAAENSRMLAHKEVTFTTDRGTFSNGTPRYSVMADAAGEAKAYLMHGKVETAHVTISVPDGVSEVAEVSFITAYPDLLAVQVSTSSIPDTVSATVDVTVKLLKMPGEATAGQIVFFYESTEGSAPVGAFSMDVVQSDDAGEAHTVYKIQNQKYHGYIYINAYVLVKNDIRLVGTNKLFVYDANNSD